MGVKPADARARVSRASGESARRPCNRPPPVRVHRARARRTRASARPSAAHKRAARPTASMRKHARAAGLCASVRAARARAPPDTLPTPHNDAARPTARRAHASAARERAMRAAHARYGRTARRPPDRLPPMCMLAPAAARTRAASMN